MMLTGKARTKFENWFYSKSWENYGNEIISLVTDTGYVFEDIPLSMMWGALQDFSLSEGYVIQVIPDSVDNWIVDILEEDCISPFYRVIEPKEYTTLTKAREAAIKELNTILNKDQ